MKKKNNFLIYLFTIMLMFVMFANSCNKDENKDTTGPVPIIITSAVSDITSSTAKCGGSITSDGGSTIIVRGVCWSTGITPTITDNKTTDGYGTGDFTSTLTGLSTGISGTTYYVRSYATTNNGTGYGNTLSFTTLPGGSAGTVTDIDGNIYNTIIIGTQVWMVENLKVTKYRNGTTIPNITDNTAWANLTTGACSDYENTANNSLTYGKLYNWYAVKDSQNIAPTGWHIPSDSEWTILTDYLGGTSIAGGKLKEKELTHWSDPNTGATNENGFTALPGGRRIGNGKFSDVRDFGSWWSSTENTAGNAWFLYVWHNYIDVTRSYDYETSGFSVRCLRDK